MLNTNTAANKPYKKSFSTTYETTIGLTDPLCGLVKPLVPSNAMQQKSCD